MLLQVVWDIFFLFLKVRIDHFTVVCSLTRPLNGSEAGGDVVLIQTSLLCFANQVVRMLMVCVYMRKAERFVTSSLATIQRLGY